MTLVSCTSTVFTFRPTTSRSSWRRSVSTSGSSAICGPSQGVGGAGEAGTVVEQLEGGPGRLLLGLLLGSARADAQLVAVSGDRDGEVASVIRTRGVERVRGGGGGGGGQPLLQRSEERRVGKECVRTCRTGGSP